jgi:hypothetical protein
LFLESNVDPDHLSQEEALQVWNEEAAKLDAGDESPAPEVSAAAAGDPPQNESEPEPQAAQPEQPEDPLAGLPEIVRAKLAEIDQLKQANAQLLHHVKTTEGRVAAIQREADLARRAATQVAPQDAPSQGQIADAAKSPEEWEQLKQDFPEWASAIDKKLTAELSRLKAPTAGLSPEQVQAMVAEQVAQTKAEMAQAIEEARVEGKYDNWRETVNSPEFAQWFSVQAPEVRTLAASSAARDAIRMLDLYHQAKAKPAAEIKQERGARLAAAATTRPGQTPPPRTVDDMSPEELWNYEAAKREKTRAQRGY